MQHAWKTLAETGCIPAYKKLRLDTVQLTGVDFDPHEIDQRLITNKGTTVTLLGIMHIEPNTKILQDIDNLIQTIRRTIIVEAGDDKFHIQDVSEAAGLSKDYARVIFRLAEPYGNFWNGAGYSNAPIGAFGAEEFRTENQSVLDTYLRFQGIVNSMISYYDEDARREKRQFPLVHTGSRAAAIEIQSNEDDPFPIDIFYGTRKYLEQIASQAILCYRHGLYDASLVMIRKLLETLIIEAHERHGLSGTIKNEKDEYFYLNDLIQMLLKQQMWTISRNARTGLPGIKKLADISAHNRRFVAKKSDVDRQTDLRIVLEELIHLIDYSSWNNVP